MGLLSEINATCELLRIEAVPEQPKISSPLQWGGEHWGNRKEDEFESLMWFLERRGEAGKPHLTWNDDSKWNYRGSSSCICWPDLELVVIWSNFTVAQIHSCDGAIAKAVR